MQPGIRRLAHDLFRVEMKSHRVQVATAANHHIQQDDAPLFTSNPVNLGLQRAPAMVAYKHVHRKMPSKERAY
jgi:hypothetical protein